ncbi:integrator complex subunit 12 [Drosophila grimshawi]|uniref:Integrator complex subunit 12 n=1 Tax=Drosophila grimshawi TaxID=7222 RepID=B4JY74_DROGR|nr:integrator complex subunit 12 [Drosophila grimshawi]XP_032597578.1 integrator complex subunit 12 [Drosophila grimshawi]EDV90636.1 GH14241 [Drosophila grimshawi]
MAANIVAAAAATQEVDPVLKKAIKLLHSTNASSASELRLLLDEALKLRFGPDKMIAKNLSQRLMDDEANFPGRATPQPQQAAQAIATDEIINLTNSPDKAPSDSPDTIADSDDGSTTIGGLVVAMSGVVNTGDTGDFGDLNCCVCGEMVFTATNRLIECSKCGALYHQECHKPAITNEEASDDQEHIWQCDNCCNKPTTSRAATTIAAPNTVPTSTPTLTPSVTCQTGTPTVLIPDEPLPLAANKAKSSVPSSRSSTSSNSSSPFYKPELSSSANVASSSGSGSKHGHKSSSSSKSHKEERGSSKSDVAHSLNTIGGQDKHSATSSSSRRISSNTKSSSSKSKHHESSSSSKRRSK